jgi:hypothetical protein
MTPRACSPFAKAHPRAIFKPVQGGAHARRLTPEHLTRDRLDNLRIAPITLQEEVPGTNVRVFVAGRRMLACEIASDELDYRNDEAPRIVPHELPAGVQAVMQDHRRRARPRLDRYGFQAHARGPLRLSGSKPSPMFLGFEEQTGLPLTEALADLLSAP